MKRKIFLSRDGAGFLLEDELDDNVQVVDEADLRQKMNDLGYHKNLHLDWLNNTSKMGFDVDSAKWEKMVNQGYLASKIAEDIIIANRNKIVFTKEGGTVLAELKGRFSNTEYKKIKSIFLDGGFKLAPNSRGRVFAAIERMLGNSVKEIISKITSMGIRVEDHA